MPIKAELLLLKLIYLFAREVLLVKTLEIEETDLKLQASGPSTHEKLRIVTFNPNWHEL